MKSTLKCALFGFAVGVTITSVTGLYFTDAGYWALILPIAIVGSFLITMGD